MPISAESLANRVRQKYQADPNIPFVTDDPTAEAALFAMCEAIIEEIKENAIVPSGIAVSTTGTAAAQTGTTTGTGTIE